jgi:hypothetical protein
MSIKNNKKNGEAESSSQMPAGDLEQYGVWVKAGPETVEEDAFTNDDFELSDLSDSTADLTAEEENLLGSLEENSPEDSGDLSFDSEDDFSFPDIEDLKLEDTKQEDAESSIINDSGDDFSFPDIEDIQENASTSLSLSALEEDLSLPEEEALTTDSAEQSEAPEESAAAESMDLDFTLDEEAFGEDNSEDFNDIAAVEQEMSAPPAEKPEEEEEKAPETEKAPPAAPPPAAQPSQDSVNILSKIEEELASIKAELAELKKELSGLRSVPSVSSGAAETDAHHKNPAADSGFFADDEDEDETIALTGDELDNILSTADITEANGEPDVLPDDIDFNFGAEASEASADAGISDDELTIDFGPAPETETAGISLDAGEDAEESAPFEEIEESEEINIDLDEQEDSAAFEESAGTEDISAQDEEPALSADEIDNFEFEGAEEEDLGVEISEPEDIISAPPESPVVFEEEDIISLDDVPAAAETIPLTTPEEQAIIDEYNRELDNFGSEELHVGEDVLADGETPALVFERNLETGEAQEKEISEKIPLDDSALNEYAEGEETGAEFDLDSLQESETAEISDTEAEAEEETPPAFEEELAEIEIEAPAPAEAPEEKAATSPERTRKAKKEPPKKSAEEEETAGTEFPETIKDEIKSVLKYMDQLLESLPEDKIQEFAQSEHFDVYRRLFEELGLE